ncbi:hypothetical protein LCGC14_2529060 [marine sediment metagenome]|uniref:Uncharacterized protein n=1 Tax=marine sediment metagenome TaxID=412755 RepID=A0A0F9D5N5_9ZZZZ
MVKNKDTLFIECECVNRHAILTIDFLEKFDEFNLDFYRKYPFKQKKEIDGLVFSKDQAKRIIEYLQNKLKVKV